MVSCSDPPLWGYREGGAEKRLCGSTCWSSLGHYALLVRLFSKPTNHPGRAFFFFSWSAVRELLIDDWSEICSGRDQHRKEFDRRRIVGGEGVR